MKVKRARRAVLLVLGACAAAVLGRVLVCHTYVFLTGPKEQAFDSRRWRSNWTLSCTPIRQSMASDLVARHRFDGLPRSSVEELLGPPDTNTYWSNYEDPNAMIYSLGGRGIDWEWLVIRFGEDDVVRECEIIRE